MQYVFCSENFRNQESRKTWACPNDGIDGGASDIYIDHMYMIHISGRISLMLLAAVVYFTGSSHAWVLPVPGDGDDSDGPTEVDHIGIPFR